MPTARLQSILPVAARATHLPDGTSFTSHGAYVSAERILMLRIPGMAAYLYIRNAGTKKDPRRWWGARAQQYGAEAAGRRSPAG